MSTERAQSIPFLEILEKIKSVSTQETLQCVTNLLSKNKDVDNITVVSTYLASRGEDSNPFDAERWIINMLGCEPSIAPVTNGIPLQKYNYRIYDTDTIQRRSVKNYIASFRVPLELAQRYTHEVRLSNTETEKLFRALGYFNERGGHEIFNAGVSTCIGKRDVTLIRGTSEKRYAFHIFPLMLDFWAAILKRDDGPQLQEDAFILNDMRNLPKLTAYVNKHGYRLAYSWMNNDEVGKKATKALEDFCQAKKIIRHKPMNDVSPNFISLSVSHMMKQAGKAVTHA